MSKYFKNLRSAKKAADPIPRKIEEIKADNDKLVTNAGIVQYQVYALERDLKQINEAIVNLNYEAAARQKLDKEIQEPKQEPKKEDINVTT